MVSLAAKPGWFPDWSNMPAVIVAGGASAAGADLSLIRGSCRILAVNRACELAQWADALYAADGNFWDYCPAARAFAGLRITGSRDAARAHDLRLVAVTGDHQILMETAAIIGHGGHSGFQALNLVAQFGARLILLIGFDLRGDHWHAPHRQPLRNPRPQSFDRWRRRLDGQAERLRELGVEVINCSPQSALTAYRKLPLTAALAGLEPAKAA